MSIIRELHKTKSMRKMATLRLGAARDYLVLEENPLRRDRDPGTPLLSICSRVHSSIEAVVLGRAMSLSLSFGRL